jgi:hypothetical protein
MSVSLIMALIKEDLSGCFIVSPKWKVSLSAKVVTKARGWQKLAVPSSRIWVDSCCLNCKDMKDIVRSKYGPNIKSFSFICANRTQASLLVSYFEKIFASRLLKSLLALAFVKKHQNLH